MDKDTDPQGAADLDLLEPNALADEQAEPEGEAAAPEPSEEDAEKPEKPEGEEQDTASEDKKPKKRKQSADERIAELTKKFREEERKRIAAEARLKPVPQSDLTAPDPKSYELGDQDPNYIADLALHKADQRREKARADEAKRAEEDQAKERQIDWSRRVSEASARYSDYREVALNPTLPITDPMASAIQEAESGPDVLYYLGQNPDEAARIATLSPTRQAIEIGRIETRLETDDEPVPPKRTTAAPEPPKRVSGRGTPDRPIEKMSYEEYKAHRRKQVEAGR